MPDALRIFSRADRRRVLLPAARLVTRLRVGADEQVKAPRAVSGVLELRDSDFAQNGNVDLPGEWAFYWKELFEPADFEGHDLPVPTDFATLQKSSGLQAGQIPAVPYGHSYKSHLNHKGSS